MAQRRIDLPHCDTLLLVRAAETLAADLVRIGHHTAVARGTAFFTQLVSETLRSEAVTLLASAKQLHMARRAAIGRRR
jgi:hypothetical protein